MTTKFELRIANSELRKGQESPVFLILHSVFAILNSVGNEVLP
jgi:hypothetical protein